MAPSSPPFPVTPDGRYWLVRGRLRRAADPSLAPAARDALIAALRRARAALARARRRKDRQAAAAARARVEAARLALGETGPVWWDDGAPDLGGRQARETPYAEWWRELSRQGAAGPRRRRWRADDASSEEEVG